MWIKSLLVDLEAVFVQHLDRCVEGFQLRPDGSDVARHHDGHIFGIDQPARERIEGFTVRFTQQGFLLLTVVQRQRASRCPIAFCRY